MADTPGYFAVGSCWSCGETFLFNPHRVPSIPIGPDGKPAEGGTRQPLCRDCTSRANLVREAEGLPLWDTSDEAYGPVEGLPE